MSPICSSILWQRMLFSCFDGQSANTFCVCVCVCVAINNFPSASEYWDCRSNSLLVTRLGGNNMWHSRNSVKVKNEWSYTSASPMCLHGVGRDSIAVRLVYYGFDTGPIIIRILMRCYSLSLSGTTHQLLLACDVMQNNLLPSECTVLSHFMQIPLQHNTVHAAY
jgi:hypothetical protein